MRRTAKTVWKSLSLLFNVLVGVGVVAVFYFVVVVKVLPANTSMSSTCFILFVFSHRFLRVFGLYLNIEQLVMRPCLGFLFRFLGFCFCFDTPADFVTLLSVDQYR